MRRRPDARASNGAANEAGAQPLGTRRSGPPRNLGLDRRRSALALPARVRDHFIPHARPQHGQEAARTRLPERAFRLGGIVGVLLRVILGIDAQADGRRQMQLALRARAGDVEEPLGLEGRRIAPLEAQEAEQGVVARADRRTRSHHHAVAPGARELSA